VRELVNTRQFAGTYTIIWDGKNNSGKEVASGIYFYLLKAADCKETKKLVLLKWANVGIQKNSWWNNIH